MTSLKRHSDGTPSTTRPFKLPRRLKQTGFLDLPGELRNHIYELSLVAAEPIDLLGFAQPDTFQRPPQRHSLTPALLSACQDIYEEAIGVLYGMNTFVVTIRTRPSTIEQSGLRMNGSLDTSRDVEVICLSDRPKFKVPRSMPGARLTIELAPPAELHDEDTETYHERLLQDVCAGFLPKIETLEISTRKIEDEMGEWGEIWETLIEQDFDRSSDVLDMALAFVKPPSVVTLSDIYVLDSEG